MAVWAQDVCAPFRMVKSTAAVDSKAASFFWRVRKAGLPDSYVVGTFHSGAPSIRAKWETLPLLFPQLKMVLTETSFDQDSAQKFTERSLNHGESLQNQLGPLGPKALAMLTEYGVSMAAVDRLKPWAAFLRLARSKSEAASVDAAITGEAAAASLPVLGLESSSEALDDMEKLSVSDQVEILKETLCSHEAVLDQIGQMEQDYLQDRAPEFVADADNLTSPVPGLADRMAKALVGDRNGVFISRAQPYLSNGGVLFLVGASHLYGEGGLLDLLVKGGFEVEPLDREVIAADLLAKANVRVAEAKIMDGLLEWLKSNAFSVPENYEAPRLEFVKSTDLRGKGCDEDDDCQVELQKSGIKIALSQQRAIFSGDVRFLGQLLSYLVRDIQAKAAPNEIGCGFWKQKSVEGLIMEARYLGSHGLPSFGLKPLPLTTCVP